MKRVLFDHCVPKSLRRWLPSWEVWTCFEQGWAALSNGQLLNAAETAGFDVFLTADQSLRYQQNLAARRVPVTELPTNRLSLLPLLVPVLSTALEHTTAGSYEATP